MRFIHIKRIDLAEITAGRFHQIEAVFLGFGKRLFVRKNNPFGEFLQTDKADKALNLFLLPISFKLFFINVQAGIGILPKDAAVYP